MKVYTIQKKGVLEKVDKEGFYIPTHKPFLTAIEAELFEDLRQPYEWIEKRYEKLNNLLDRPVIWVFNKPIFFNNAQFGCSEEHLQYTFEVPMKQFKENFLWSDYDLWHYHLNQFEGWEKEVSLFDVNPKKELAQGITTRLNQSWLVSISKPQKSNG